MIVLRILAGRQERMRTTVSAAQLRSTLDLIHLELVHLGASLNKRIVVVADYGDVAAIVYRREPQSATRPLPHSA
jgi:hypothetical protein